MKLIAEISKESVNLWPCFSSLFLVKCGRQRKLLGKKEPELGDLENAQSIPLAKSKCSKENTQGLSLDKEIIGLHNGFEFP